jgi:hypothetical protein
MSNLTLRKLIVRMMLYTALMPYFISLTTLLTKSLFNLYGIKNFHKSYIATINTPSYKNTRKVLEEFNALGDNKIVSFSEIPDGRPIEIVEITPIDRQISPGAVGTTYAKITRCTIKMAQGLDEIEYRETLLHEYLHCYGYDHVDDYKDLMYYSLFPVDKEENIRHYAKEVKKKFYE